MANLHPLTASVKVIWGLFRNDKPYGPGVLTYTDGRQDVGIWCGSQIYRLCTTVGFIDKLSITPENRAQVTKFKLLISINQNRDVATEILLSIKDNDKLKPMSSKLYSRFCKNPTSYLFDHKVFSDEVNDLEEVEGTLENISQSRCTINSVATNFINESKSQSAINSIATNFVNTDIIQMTEQNQAPQSNTQLNPNSGMFLLSWNNGNKLIEIMKHSFKYRRQEDVTDYDIGNILCGRRDIFGKRGLKEDASIKILNASATNDVQTIVEMLHKHTLNVDVMDNKGNSMILRAAANDALDVIQLLYVLGADIDAVNDEGFSALTYTLTRYIALKYDVDNWAEGFLPPFNMLSYDELEEDKVTDDMKWMDTCMTSNISITSGNQIMAGTDTSSERPGSKSLKGNQKVQAGPEQEPKRDRSPSPFSIRSKYVFDLTPEPRKLLSPTKVKKRKYNISAIPEKEVKLEDQIEKEEKLKIIENTAFYLLGIGVNLNTSKTPESLMVLAIFSGNLQIIEKLLEMGADPNEKLSINNGGLTALHLIAQARPLHSYPTMVNLFLKYGADPNLRTFLNTLVVTVIIGCIFIDLGEGFQCVSLKIDAVVSNKLTEDNEDLASHDGLHRKGNYNIGEWAHLLEHIKLPNNLYVEGITPLHIIALRSDATYVADKEYLEQVCCILSWFSDHREFFLGLSPFGLAISKGNYNIVSMMIKCAIIDVNATFDEFWGNPLGTYLRFHGFSNDPAATEMLQILILHGVDPLMISSTLRGKGNALNFIAELRSKLQLHHTKQPSQTEFAHPPESKAALRVKEQILTDLAKLRLRKFIRGVLIRLLLKYVTSKENIIIAHRTKQLKLKSTISFNNNLKGGNDMSVNEEAEINYGEVYQRIQEWMSCLDEFLEIVEKTVDKLSHIYSPVQTIQLMSMVPSLYIAPRKTSIQERRLKKFLEGKSHDLKNHDLSESGKGKTKSEPGTSFINENLLCIQNLANDKNSKLYVYPELDDDKKKYFVCYTCLRQTKFAQTCPSCRLVYFCSMKCNVIDVKKPDGYHCCCLVFYNLKLDQFFAFRKSPPEKQEQSKLPMPTDKKIHSKKHKKHVSSIESMMEDDLQEKKVSTAVEVKRSKIEEKMKIPKKSEVLLKSKKDMMNARLLGLKEKASHIKSTKKKMNKKDKKSMKKQKGMQKSKIKGKRALSVGSTRTGKSFKSYMSRGTIGSSPYTLGLYEKEMQLKEDKMQLKDQTRLAAKMLEENLKNLEKRQQEIEKLKDAQRMVDIDFLGGIASPEEYWEKEKEVSRSLIERFQAFLFLLHLRFSKTFDIDNYLPYIVFIDGKMYFKYYGDRPEFLENYSFN